MLANQKVTKLHDDGTFDQFSKFLTKKSYKSENTAMAYRNDITKFFNVVKNKEIKYITKADLDLTLDHFEEFQAYLHDQKLSNKTINRNVAAVKEFIKYLRGKKHIEFDTEYLNLIDSLPEQKNQYGVLSIEEVEKMTDLIMTLPKIRDREMKKFLFLFSLDTCARLDNCLKLKWSDFQENENDVQISMIAKGNKDFRPRISKGFYKELLKIKTENELVFPISSSSVSDLMARLRKEMNISDSRKVVFHSLRKCGGSFQFRLHGDIHAAQKALGHSNINTTTIYLDDQDYGLTGAVSSRGRVSEEYYKEVDHDVLIKAISKLPKSQQLLLNIKIDEVIKNDN
ncbi:tyrosine-type recombinase/integrase [Rossellomorea marisflavi]|uniref:Tyrosine-type recombinase/integrase n=1 Tax=Rossellomorea marisflavi TaxID=189381 RepID=A0A5D4RZI7_9BACI|nr:tyrosine-type recombinase/integrase [Rossellomorea marisflavi]TYS56380.1 tyrosine-type recombinase/integrase [Rossellomorea marisflavi]